MKKQKATLVNSTKFSFTPKHGHYLMLLFLFLLMPLFIVVILFRQGYMSSAQVSNCTVSAADYGMDSQELAVINLLNSYRQQNGLQPLTVSATLTQAASWMSRDLATRQTLNHTDSLGRTFNVRIANCGYAGLGTAENLAQTGQTAQQVFSLWQQSAAQNANMLYPTWQAVGVADAQSTNGYYYWTLDFGSNPDNDPSLYTPTVTLSPTDSPTPTESPTPTDSPTPTSDVPPIASEPATLQLSVKLHGIGSGGDNLNPNSSGGNNNPVHPQRPISVELTNPQITGVLPVQQGTMVYDPTQGIFTASFTLDPAIFPQGEYLVTISTPTYLHRLVPSIQNLVPGETTNLTVDLIAGDADGDNHLTILDYNELFDCFSSLAPPIACSDDIKSQTDFNDDGKVDQVDYNLFLRELAAQNGN